VSGALAERVFVHKLKKIGFTNVKVVERLPFALEQAAEYPLFTDEVIGLMRDLIPVERHGQIAVSVTITAENP
jgi:arsenite methyltransferase